MNKINKTLVIIVLTILLLIKNYYVLASSLNSSQLNFKVQFSGDPQVSNKAKVKADITDNTNATINVSNMNMKENTETVTYIIQNTSEALSTELSVETNNSNEEYFSLSYNIEKATLKKGEATKLTITIKLIKEPLLKSEKATIGVQLKAVPVQPTEDKGFNSGNNTSNGVIDYFKKDDTPKTGTSIWTNIFGG